MTDKLIDLHSDLGQRLLQEACAPGQGVCQPYLGAVFSKQRGGYSCGVQSCALLLAAASLGKETPLKSTSDCPEKVQDVHSLPFTEEKLLGSSTVNSVLAQTLFRKGNGLTLDEVHRVLTACGHEAEAVHTTDSSLDEFRARALQVLSDLNSSVGIIVNYHMQVLGQGPPYGHHSPLGAYHKETDRFLIYDCWSDTKECWAKTEDLFHAMDTVDEDSQKTRGFCVLKKPVGI